MGDGSSESSGTRRLILRLMERDEDALRDLADHCSSNTMCVLERKYYELLDASEFAAVLNQVVYNVWRSIGSYDPSKGSFDGWLYRIAEREVVNCLRQDKSGGAAAMLEFDPSVDGRRPDDSSFTDPPVVKELLNVIENLSPLQKAIVLADLASGDKADDERLARMHGSTVPSVRASRSIARKKIREAMPDQAYDGRKS